MTIYTLSKEFVLYIKVKQAVEAEQKYMQEIASSCELASNNLDSPVECTNSAVQEVSTSTKIPCIVSLLKDSYLFLVKFYRMKCLPGFKKG